MRRLLLLCLLPWAATSFCSPATRRFTNNVVSSAIGGSCTTIGPTPHGPFPPNRVDRSLCMSSEAHNDNQEPEIEKEDDSLPADLSPLSFWQSWWSSVRSDYSKAAQVEDFEVLLFDVFLILNLVVSISFWVVHRMEIDWIALALNEGCLVSLCWLGAGLGTGAFLYSAVDGHYLSDDQRGGPVGAAKLAFHTYLNAINIRLLVALVIAVCQHRPVGGVGGESLLPLELGLGLVLMPLWRMLHSRYLLRM